jgi:hypothetical protein
MRTLLVVDYQFIHHLRLELARAAPLASTWGSSVQVVLKAREWAA